MSGNPLGWQETVQGNVKLTGRPLSLFTSARQYHRSLVVPKISAAIVDARQMVQDVQTLLTRSVISAAEMHVGSGPHGAVTPLPKYVTEAARIHFRLARIDEDTAKDYGDLFAFLGPQYMQIGAGLNGRFEIVDNNNERALRGEPAGTDPRSIGGYVGVNPGSQIHLNFAALQQKPVEEVARLLVHEASHKFINTDDKAYCGSVNYALMGPADARVNADSFAWFALATWKNGIHA